MKKSEDRMLTLFIVILIGFALHALYPTGSTDKSRWRRSGLSVYTDHLTGVQYVKSGFFGDITPRLDRDGLPIYEGKEGKKDE